MPLPYTPLPQTPDRKRPTTFADEGDAFLGALPTFGSQMAAIGAQAETNAATAAADAITASSAAATAVASANTAVNAPGTQATSTTSVVIGLGSKSFTIQTGKAFAVGQPVTIADNAAPGTNWMAGNITAHTPGTGAITINVLRTSGSGTIASWTIALAGPVNTATTLAGYGITDAVSSNGGTVNGNLTVTGTLDYDDTVVVISTNTTAVKSRTYVMTASLVLTLPASPQVGDWVRFKNKSGVTTCSIGRNAQNIEGLAEDMTISDLHAGRRLVFADATRGWVLV